MKKRFGYLLMGLMAAGSLAACQAEETPAVSESDSAEVIEAEEGTEAAETADADAVSRPTSSMGSTIEELNAAMTPEGAWVFGLTQDIVSDADIVIDGNIHFSNDPSKDYQRKIGLYRNDSDHNLVELYNLTAASITTSADNTRLLGGEIDGQKAVVTADIYVNAPGFILEGVELNGNIIFATTEYADSLVVIDSVINGDMTVAE